MFKKNCLYRHNNCRTVAFEVIKSFYIKEKKLIKLTVWWWNISSIRVPIHMGITQKITIPLEKIHEYNIMSYGSFGPPPVHVHHGE